MLRKTNRPVTSPSFNSRPSPFPRCATLAMIPTSAPWPEQMSSRYARARNQSGYVTLTTRHLIVPRPVRLPNWSTSPGPVATAPKSHWSGLHKSVSVLCGFYIFHLQSSRWPPGAKAGQFSAPARVLEPDCPGQRRGGREKEHHGGRGFPGCSVRVFLRSLPI
ncbi:uncharacterized protein LY79DRAFT_543573, partial [Colletotrichum navitas]